LFTTGFKFDLPKNLLIFTKFKKSKTCENECDFIKNSPKIKPVYLSKTEKLAGFKI